MTLGHAQELFVRLEAQWLNQVLALSGVALRHGEGRILQKGPDNKGRRVIHIWSGLSLRVKDLVHMDGSTHYLGIGADYNLFVDGQWIADGSHPMWKHIGQLWERQHPLCRWGGRFKSVDANHFSLEYQGVK